MILVKNNLGVVVNRGEDGVGGSASYGVISQNRVPYLIEEIINSGVNLSLLEFADQLKSEARAEVEELLVLPNRDTQQELRLLDIQEQIEQDDFPTEDYEESYYEDTIIFGDWEQDEEGLYYPLRDGSGSKGFAAQTSGFDVMVVWSKYIEFCNGCSPCFPNAGNLEQQGNLRTFGLPPDMIVLDSTEEKCDV